MYIYMCVYLVPLKSYSIEKLPSLQYSSDKITIDQLSNKVYRLVVSTEFYLCTMHRNIFKIIS